MAIVLMTLPSGESSVLFFEFDLDAGTCGQAPKRTTTRSHPQGPDIVAAAVAWRVQPQMKYQQGLANKRSNATPPHARRMTPHKTAGRSSKYAHMNEHVIVQELGIYDNLQTLFFLGSI